MAQGQLLRKYRERESLSREKVARMLDPPVVGRTVERWENGQHPVPKHRLRELAHIYRVPVRDLEVALLVLAAAGAG